MSHWQTIRKVIYCLLHLCATVFGALAAMFGSQADINVDESRFALLLGTCLALSGVALARVFPSHRASADRKSKC